MSLEDVLEQTAHARPGHDLVAFKEAGLPIFVLRLRILVAEHKPISPIEEAVLKAVQAGLSSPTSIFEFLGLSKAVLTPVLAGLNTLELINYSRSSADIEAKVTLSAKGRNALAELATVRPQERVVPVCFDALTKKLLFIAPEQLYRSREIKEMGFVEVPVGNSKRPEVEDIPLQDFDKVLQRRSHQSETPGILLAIRRIERRELQYLGCVMLYYANPAHPGDIEVAFWRDDGFAMQHELAFQAIGGPDLVGSRLLAADVVRAPQIQVPAEPKSVAGDGAVERMSDSPHAQAHAQDKSSEQVQSPAAETMQTLLCYEHPAFLKKALTSARQRLVIVSPWITHWVVDWPFVASLEALLRNGVQVHIGYGIDEADGGGKKNAAKEKPAITPYAERDLKDLAARFKNFHFVYVGNTHRKSLVCDDEFAVVTSFNWLSFKGDSQGKPRDERGVVFRKKQHVERLAAEELELLSKGYSGAPRGGSARHVT
jgi:DNA-binding MarR family transcriptional regulator